MAEQTAEIATELLDHKTATPDPSTGEWACQCGQPLTWDGTPPPFGVAAMDYRIAEHHAQVVIDQLGLRVETETSFRDLTSPPTRLVTEWSA